jgi:hypothetical protein
MEQRLCQGEVPLDLIRDAPSRAFPIPGGGRPALSVGCACPIGAAMNQQAGWAFRLLGCRGSSDIRDSRRNCRCTRAQGCWWRGCGPAARAGDSRPTRDRPRADPPSRARGRDIASLLLIGCSWHCPRSKCRPAVRQNSIARQHHCREPNRRAVDAPVDALKSQVCLLHVRVRLELEGGSG